MFAVIFVLLGIVICFVYKEMKLESSEGKLALQEVTALKSSVIEQKKLLEANIRTVALCNDRFNTILDLAEELKKDCDQFDHRFDAVEALCAKIKRVTIKLQEKVSNISPTIKMEQPIKVDVVGQGVKALIK